MRRGGSPSTSITVGAVIQFSGFWLLPPPSEKTRKVPSRLIISRRSPIGSRELMRPRVEDLAAGDDQAHVRNAIARGATLPGRVCATCAKRHSSTLIRAPRGGGNDELRLRHRRRRLSGVRARQSTQRGPFDASAGAGGRPPRSPVGSLHPHAGGAVVPDRQPLLRLEVRVRARAGDERPAHLPRARQGPRRVEQDQRHDLPARQPPGLRALGRRPGHGRVGLRPLPAVLQAHGDLHRRRRHVARRRRAARARARPGEQPALPRVLRGRAAGRLPADQRRQRLPPGGLRRLRPQHPPRPAAERGARLPASGGAAPEPRGALRHDGQPRDLRRHPRGRRRGRAARQRASASRPAR